MEIQTIRVETRQDHGKGIARKLRETGRIPAVAYGPNDEPLSLTLDPSDLRRLRKSRLGWNQPVTLEVDGAADIPMALLRDVQKHPISGRLLHADFLRVAPGVAVRVRIPVKVVGESAGEIIGGVINQPRRELVMLCQPEKIPAALEVDVTPLEIGDKILLSELTLPEGCELELKTDATVASCVGRRGGAEEDEDEDEDGEEAEEASEGDE